MAGGPKLVVGLGNPGAEYAETRHNIGFAVVDELGRRHDCSFKKKWRFDALVGEIRWADERVTLAKPQTYMNRSGRAVVALMLWRKLSPADLLVVVDDADLPLGEIRLRPGGGSGGHNGLRSISQSLGGDQDYPRLRVGIGRHGGPDAGLSDHVLSRFGAEERATADAATDRAAEALECCLAEGLAVAMNRYNRRSTDSGERDDRPGAERSN